MFKLAYEKIKPIVGMKKTIVYSDENEKTFMEGVLNIYATAEKKTAAAVLEDIVAKSVLPSNINARAICKDLFISKSNTIDALEGIFDLYAAGINFEARYQNGQEFIQFLQSHTYRIGLDDNEESKSDRYYFSKNFGYIVERIKWNSGVSENEILSATHPAEYAEDLLNEVKEEPRNFAPANFTNLVIDNWELLGNYTYTYRALVGLCRAIKDQKIDTADERIELVELIKKLSVEWK